MPGGRDTFSNKCHFFVGCIPLFKKRWANFAASSALLSPAHLLSAHLALAHSSLCLVVPLSHAHTHIPQTLVHKHTQKLHHECTHTQTQASRHTDRVSLSPAATARLFLLLLYCPPIKTLWACKMGLGRTSHLVTFLTKPNPYYPFEMSPRVGC